MKNIDWPALTFTLVLIIAVREFSVWVMQQFHHPELGNLVGLGFLLVLLIIWRRINGIPARILDANAMIMRESAFAFLPISAGAILMLIAMGNEIPLFMLVLVLSTLIPLWVYAKLAKHWL